jgi:Bacterial regulatory helix-turn-helix protein, lysR family
MAWPWELLRQRLRAEHSRAKAAVCADLLMQYVTLFCGIHRRRPRATLRCATWKQRASARPHFKRRSNDHSPRMELRHLRYFITVADELNFTRAAALLHTAQPSPSQQILDLENEVGVQLLERSNRKVELTEAGEVFLAEARVTLAQADRAVARARHVARQQDETVTIGFVPATEVRVFPTILPRLRMHFPHVRVELRSLSTMA